MRRETKTGFGRKAALITTASLMAASLFAAAPAYAKAAETEGTGSEDTGAETEERVVYDGFDEAYSAVIDIVSENYNEDTEYGAASYGFAYIDNNTVPELVVAFPGGGIEILTYGSGTYHDIFGTYDDYYTYDDAGNAVVGEWYVTYYMEKQNMVCMNYCYKDDINMVAAHEVYLYSIDDSRMYMNLDDSFWYDYDGDTWMHEEQAITEEELYDLLGGAQYQDFNCPYNAEEAKQELDALAEAYDAASLAAMTQMVDNSMDRDELYDKYYQQEYDTAEDFIEAYYEELAEKETEDTSDSTFQFSDEEIMEIADTVEEGYEFITDLDPELSDVLAADAGQRFGTSIASTYFIEKGVGGALGGGTVGTVVREGAIVGVLEAINLYMASLPTYTYCDVDCLRLLDIAGDYELAFTYGELGDILDKTQEECNYYEHPLYLRAVALYNANGRDYDSTATEDVINVARLDALDDKMDEYQAVYEALLADVAEAFDIAENDAADSYDHIYCVLNKEGEIICAVRADGYAEGLVDAEGNFCLRLQDGCGYAIFDKEANLLFRSTTEINYSPLSSCQSFLGLSNHQDFDYGSYTQVDFLDLSGNTKTILRCAQDSFGTHGFHDEDSRYMEIYYETLEGGNVSQLVDMEDGSLISYDEYDEREKASEETTQFPEGFDASACEVLNDTCFFHWDDNKIYDFSGEELTDLSAGGGVAQIHYDLGENCYWVISNTDYYYVLDEDFTRRFEPKLLEGKYEILLTDYGMLMEVTGTACAEINGDVCTHWLNKDGKIKMEFHGADLSDFHGWIFGNALSGWANLNTGEWMIFNHIPEFTSGIDI